MTRDKWVWMPHAAHFICGNDCRFHLATYVGGYVVSTVGEYLPDSQVREILAQSRRITLNGKGDERLADYMKKVGYEDLGYQRKYETMVFKAERMTAKGDQCCPWRMKTPDDVDMEGYNTPEAATAGHMKLCEKWSKKQSQHKEME